MTSRWMAWGGVLMIVFALAFPAYRLLEPGRRAEAKEVYTTELSIQGAEIYELNCAQCHGPEGGGGLAPGLVAKQFLQQAEDEQIRQLVAVGVPGTRMGAYLLDYGGPLTRTQVDALVVFLRSQEDDAPDFPLWRTPLAQEGLTGRELYTMACASCHLTDLSGDTGSALGPGSDAVEDSDDRLARRRQPSSVSRRGESRRIFQSCSISGLFAHPSFRHGNVIVTIVGLGEFGLVFVSPLYLQTVLGYPPSRPGRRWWRWPPGGFWAVPPPPVSPADSEPARW